MKKYFLSIFTFLMVANLAHASSDNPINFLHEITVNIDHYIRNQGSGPTRFIYDVLGDALHNILSFVWYLAATPNIIFPTQ